MTRSQIVALALLVAVLAPLPLAGKEAIRKPMRGVAILASSIGGDVSEEEVLVFVEECRIDLVVIDFAWVTGIWPQTDLKALDSVTRKLQKAGVVVAAMYRPRALRKNDADVHYARDAAGRTSEHHLSLCFAHEDSARWGQSWGSRILAAVPSIRHVILYNVGATCLCDACRDGKAEGNVTRFIERCRETWGTLQPKVRIGHVGVGLPYEGVVDFHCPFLSVRKGADMRENVSEVRALGRQTKKPVVPLAKVCWASATKNGTDEVVAAIEACGKRNTGFLLWYYGWIFHSDDSRYDPARVVEALGGEAAKLSRFFQNRGKPEPRSKAQGDADGRQWLSFDTKESDSGPRLCIGSTELEPSDDTGIIAYLENRSFGHLKSMGLSLGDRNRVLIAFPAKKLRGVRRAELVLTVRKSRNPPVSPFDLAVYRVTETWKEREVCWNSQPGFEAEPLLVVQVDPGETELVIDLTKWARSGRVEHGLLLKVPVAIPVKPTKPSAVPTGAWTQPPIRTGTPFTDKLPWATDVEEALARAKVEGKPVLATVVPVGDRQWVSGYAGAKEILKNQKRHAFGDERGMAIDEGLVKERVMMAVLFSDPEIAHLVRSHFVPVRLRLHTYLFDEKGRGTMRDPLAVLGTNGLELRGPSLVFSTADGKPLHAFRRIGVFSARMVRDMLRAVLAKAGVEEVEPFHDERPAGLKTAWTRSREGELDAADRALRGLNPPRGAAWASEYHYLRAHLLDARGEGEEASNVWRMVAAGDPEGPWGGRASVRLSPHGPRIDEWESVGRIDSGPLAERTEVGEGVADINAVLDRAVSQLLLTQRPDGSWRDPFVDIHPGSGPGSEWDKAIPRTGLCVDALLGMRARRPKRRAELDAAIARGIEFVGSFADSPRPHIWKLTYALHLQVAILGSELPMSAKNAAKRRARNLVLCLRDCQHSGGWSYVGARRIHSFNTAPVLLLMTELAGFGVKAPKAMLTAAAEFLEGVRLKDPRNFAYADTLKHKSVRASSCRTALIELALLKHSGDGEVKRLRSGVELFFEYEELARDATKVFESYMSPTALHDAYHYYFGHYYVARALAHLPRAEAGRLARKQIDLILPQREIDGSFVDAQMQGRSYSTAMALLTLLEDLRHVN